MSHSWIRSFVPSGIVCALRRAAFSERLTEAFQADY